VQKKYSDFNTKKSWHYLIKSKLLYEKITDEHQLKDLEKVPINKIVFQNCFDTICKRALDNAIQENTVDNYESFLGFYIPTPSAYQKIAIEKRDIVAYKNACDINNVESYQEFISKYPNAANRNEAELKRNALAFSMAKSVDKIEDYKSFLKKYPDANEVPQAKDRMHELAFASAEKENSSFAFKKFIDEYPQSKQHDKAFKLYEEKQFFEYTYNNEGINFKTFIEDFPENSWKTVAEDSLFSISSRTEDLNFLKFCVDNFKSDKREKALMLYHDIFTNDGETTTLNLFYGNYHDRSLNDLKTKDFEIASIGDGLLLNLPYNASDFRKYDEYIRVAAPREKAFVAMQRMISLDIVNKNWKAAIIKCNDYLNFFGTKNKKVTDLIALLEAKWDNSIKINSVGAGINTSIGGEYAPVISADDKLLYFCGKDRKDIIGGEDIFVSNYTNGHWGQANIVSDLSSQYSNDAPLSVSADGTTMLLFKSGKLYYSEKTTSGWSGSIEFPSTINSGNWQSDAMITSDGKALIFSSTKAGGNNIYEKPEKYHGDNLYPADIYISLLDEKNEWGEPINLGSAINTPYCDRMPFLHPDMKTLYFSSDGHGGMGKMDVFKSTRLADSCWNCWSEPINMGKEINTQESDAGYKISTPGDKAYFSFEKKLYNESSIIFLLDVSGSMQGNKIEALKETAKSVCQTAINNNSEISIISFSGNCANPITNLLPFTKDVSTMTDFVESLYANSSTPMCEAYYYASDYMKNYSNAKNKNKVITLMTDGDANGCLSLEGVFKEIKKKGITYKTQTIAFDVSEFSRAYSELQKIANFSKGKFYHAKGTDDLGSAFENANNDIFNLSGPGSNKDIFSLNIPKHLRPDLVATISGKLLDNNKKPVSAEIRWEDLETGKNVGQSKSDPVDGSFFIVLPLGKIYGYFVDKNEFFPISNNIDLRSNTNPVKLDADVNLVSFKQMIDDGTAVPVNNLFFNFNESTLLPYSIPELKRVAQIMKSKKLKVEISGHTDNIGGIEQNQFLSEQRALSVKNFLIGEGCSADNLATIGYGKTKPVATNDTDIGRAKNRRVEMKFLK
jgi:outer membrane protein OmpA-like peptidoglycan-associated protein/Mg-chelatase subunit ChlD